LTKRHWQGASLQSLIGDILAPYAAAEGRARTIGGDVELAPRACISLTMALNELATNAAKHGALAGISGVVTVRWDVKDDAQRWVQIDWLEQGGPTVIPPTRRGFGTRLMERCIERDLGGELDLRFEPAGLECRMRVPVST
jgi:two-component sensor histidine kinase